MKRVPLSSSSSSSSSLNCRRSVDRLQISNEYSNCNCECGSMQSEAAAVLCSSLSNNICHRCYSTNRNDQNEEMHHTTSNSTNPNQYQIQIDQPANIPHATNFAATTTTTLISTNLLQHCCPAASSPSSSSSSSMPSRRYPILPSPLPSPSQSLSPLTTNLPALNTASSLSSSSSSLGASSLLDADATIDAITLRNYRVCCGQLITTNDNIHAKPKTRTFRISRMDDALFDVLEFLLLFISTHLLCSTSPTATTTTTTTTSTLTSTSASTFNNRSMQQIRKPSSTPYRRRRRLKQIQSENQIFNRRHHHHHHHHHPLLSSIPAIRMSSYNKCSPLLKSYYARNANILQIFAPNIMIAPLLLLLLLVLALTTVTTAHASASSEMTTDEAFAHRLDRMAATSPVKLSRPESVCRSLDIRNTPSELRHLENCTVIEGFLLISLVNTHTISEFTQTFPLLTEVTEFIIIYQVRNLRSLAQIFPNLSIIRGRDLFEGYALVVYSNLHLEELGLSKLTTISRGGVRIEKNVMLCFVKTIDWSYIVSNTTDIVIENNRNTIECPLCPGVQKISGSMDQGENELVCKERQGRRNCWNSYTCQKFCPKECRHNCLDENTCCNESCLGGCSPNDVNECINCRNFSIHNNTCTDVCPPEYYNYLDRRCLTAASCLSIGIKFENHKQEKLVPYSGRCLTTCPEGYSKENLTCVKCVDKCMKRCVGAQIDSVARAKEFHGCTEIIDTGLTIIIKRGGRHLMEDLEYGLSSIEVIHTNLMVHGTYGMFNLHFFKNLKSIKGKKLIDNKYAFYVLENTDLESIWAANQTVQIENGTVYFHFNPKLCLSKIEALLPMMRNQTKFDKNEVSEDSNGSRGSCNTTFLNVTVNSIYSHGALLEILNPMKFEDERTFIGYQFLHIEDKYGNATKHSYRPCDDSWIVSEPIKETNYVLQGLKPFTQYAYYVKTITISTERRNGQSAVQRFKTKSSQPNMVSNLQAYANYNSSIVINWSPPTSANGKLIKYKVRAVLDLHKKNLGNRNYCKDPIKGIGKPEKPKIESPKTKQPQLSDTCKCPKIKDAVFNDEIADASIHASIELENSLQNFIYIKKTSRLPTTPKVLEINDSDTKAILRRRRAVTAPPMDSYLLRYIRSVSQEDDDDLLSQQHIRKPTYMVANETRKDAESTYYEVFTDLVDASTTEYTFQQLKHFSWYMIGVEACREPEEDEDAMECSEESKEYVRTSMLDDADKVEKLEAHLEPTNSSRSNVLLFWKRPKRPNGAVVSYTILYELQTQDAVEEKKCITELDYTKLDYEHNGYVLSGLLTGNYSIRIRANSLAGDGKYSTTVFIYIPPTTLTPMELGGICLAIIILFLLLSALIYIILRKKFLTPPSDLKIFPTVNPYYISLQYIPDEWEIARDRVIQLSQIGQGSFGLVYEGILKGFNNDREDTPCAIKTVFDNLTDRERINFLKEASVMKQFDTYHVVRLLGVCSRDQPALVIMELMKNGDLKTYLRAHRPDEQNEFGFSAMDNRFQPPPQSRIYQMAIEIADGMAYLAAMKFVHRDLAARNCMVAADLTVKIGDFGMTRDIYEADYYRKGTKGLLPVRWMPPESLRDGIYSTASDVFSYGVVLWEIMTLASQPYQGLSNDQVLRFVIEGGIMERPENCPDKLYSLMQKCWHHRPTARPTFIGIIRYLYDMSNPHFREISFYNSEEGQQILHKETTEGNQICRGDAFDEDDNDMEDVTTPLRMEEYNGYKLNVDNNSSIDNKDNSPMIMGGNNLHSSASLGSAVIISSTPGQQSKNSFQNLNYNHMVNSSPSGAGRNEASYRNTSANRRENTDNAEIHAYVQSDFERNLHKNSATDERGYELYDPNPNYSEHAVYSLGEDDDDDYSVHTTAAQILLSDSKKPHILPSILPLSSSVPEDVINQPVAASSDRSIGSANASLKTAKSAARQLSLRAVADTLGSSIIPSRLRMKNMRFFSHKRTGSNVSDGSTTSNPSATLAFRSINNLTQTNQSRNQSGQNLNLENVDLGYTPRFFTVTSGLSEKGTNLIRAKTIPTTNAFAISVNPNYHDLDDTTHIKDNLLGSEKNSNYVLMNDPQQTKDIHMNISDNPNYQMMSPSIPFGSSTSFTAQPSPQLVDINEDITKFSQHSIEASADLSATVDLSTEKNSNLNYIPSKDRPSSASSQQNQPSEERYNSSAECSIVVPKNSTVSHSKQNPHPQNKLPLSVTFSNKQQYQPRHPTPPLPQSPSPPASPAPSRPPPNGFVGRES